MTGLLVMCSRGNVRSVTAATILKDYAGVQNVIVAGLDLLDRETLNMLSEQCHILLIGDKELYARIPGYLEAITTWIDCGTDRWQRPMHPDLVNVLCGLLKEQTAYLNGPSRNYPSLEAYQQANLEAHRRAYA
jgi:hypothetical protein